jgi:hypothetical protein
MGLSFICCWSSPAQSFSGPSSAGPITIIYCLRFETPPTWRARSPHLYPPGTVCSPDIPPGTGFPFRPLLRLAGFRWRYLFPPPHWRGTRWRICLRHYATSRKDAGSILDEVIGYFNLRNRSSRTMALGLLGL